MTKRLINKLFHYKDGFLIWKVDRTPKKTKGTVAGHVNKKGYVEIGYKGKHYLSHRLIWIYHYGAIPKDMQIDHIDQNPFNSKIENLRVVTHQENNFNRSNVKGYYFNKKIQKYRAEIMINGKTIGLGYFVKEKDARLAYLEAKDALHLIGDTNA